MAKGIYFYVNARSNTRACNYNKEDMFRVLQSTVTVLNSHLESGSDSDSNHNKPIQLYESHWTYHIYWIRHEDPNLTQNDLLRIRQELERAVRQVHPKAGYGFGFDDYTIEDTPCKVYHDMIIDSKPFVQSSRSFAFCITRDLRDPRCKTSNVLNPQDHYIPADQGRQ